MNVFCPHCGSEFSVTWLTKETNGERSIVRSNDALTAVQTTLTERLNTVEGGGGVSDSGSVSGLSGSDPDPSKQISVPISTGRRGRKDRFEYPLPFLVLWQRAKQQGKSGNKFPAFKSWEKLNADAELNALIFARFEEWCQTDAWKRGYNFHFVTWLNQRGWEESPTAQDIAGTKNVAPSANGSVLGASPRGSDYCVWHQRHQNDGTVSKYARSSCPGCKAVADAEAERAHAASVAKILAERARKAQ